MVWTVNDPYQMVEVSTFIYTRACVRVRCER
jgi:hypothetical protein